jgi:5-formyltetrahydrofolate cyclo-ligase
MGTENTPEMRAGNAAETPLAARRALRQRLLERRLALPAAEWARLSAVLRTNLRAAFPQLGKRRVGFCWPVKNEPDLRPLLEAWLAAGQAGFGALLPVVVAANAPLAFRQWTPQTPLLADRYGIPSPAMGDFLTPEALLLPVNAFDAAGYRIGYGGGYFDHTLSTSHTQCVPLLAIGVGFELARVDSIDPEAHDIPLDAMVTEAGVFSCPAAAHGTQTAGKS